MEENTALRFIDAMSRLMRTNFDLPLYEGISRKQFMLLGLIYRESKNSEDGISVSRLAHIFEVSPPAISQMLNSVEEKGYVERLISKEDRRKIRIRVTPAGYDKFAQMEQNHLAFTKLLLDELGKEKTEQLLTLLDELFLIASTHKSHIKRK